MATSMTRDDIRAFAQRFLAAWELGDPDTLAAFYAPDAAVDSPMFQRAVGREQIQQMYSDTFRVFAGFKFTLDDIIIDTEIARAVAIVTSQATQIGEAFGYPGSGRQFTLKVAFVLRFDKDLVVSETRVYDFTGLLVQLGVLRAKKG